MKNHKANLLKTMLSISLIYFILAELSASISLLSGLNHLIVLESGFAVAVLLVLPLKRALAGIALGGVWVSLCGYGDFTPFLNISSRQETLIYLGIISAQAFLNYYLYQYWLIRKHSLSQNEDLLHFLQVLPIIGAVNTVFSLSYLYAIGNIDNEFSTNCYLLFIGNTLSVAFILPVVLAVLKKKNSLWQQRKTSLVLNFILSLILAVVVSFSLSQFEKSRVIDRFQILTNQTATLFQVSFRAKKVLQESVAQLFVTSHYVYRNEFQRFVRGVAGKNNALQVVEWLPKVEDEQRERYEKQQREYYGNDFNITALKSRGVLAPAPRRDVYFPITYLEPEVNNVQAQGFDPSSSPGARETIRRAVISGEAQARPPIQIFRGKEFTSALIIYRPIFENMLGIKTTNPSGGHLIGFVNIVIKVDDFVKDIIDDQQNANFHIQWQDVKTGQNYFNNTIDNSSPIQHVVELHVFGRDMRLIFSPTSVFMNETTTGLAAVSMLIILFLASLFSVLVLNITARTKRIKREVKKRTKDLEWANLQLEVLSNKDALTDLFNRRYFEKALQSEFKRVSRYKYKFALVSFDIDNFKQVNDQYGHPCGDEVIQAVAHYLLNTSRSSDIQARVGGEEFALILNVQSEAQALSIVERIRIDISNLVIDCEGKNIQFSCSFGIAIVDSDVESTIELVKMADQAMYKAKQLGKNRTILASDLELTK